jgi:CDP-diglyceride synthetase
MNRARYLAEAALLWCVAVVLVVVHVSTPTLIAVMAAAWIIVALVEWSAQLRRPRPPLAGHGKRLYSVGLVAMTGGTALLVLGGDSRASWLGSLALWLIGLALMLTARRAQRREADG